MAVEFERSKETAAEWIDTPVSDAPLALTVPQANDDYAYIGTSMFHWWPERNSKGATFYPEDISQNLLDEWVGRQVNIHHDKKMVVGNLRTVAKTSTGVEGIVEVDRDQIEAHGLDIRDFGPDNRISGSSVEFTRDPFSSKYLFHDEQNTIKDVMISAEADKKGKKRTTKSDPSKDNGLTVTERCVPVRFTGLGLTWRPADSKARMYHVTATDEDAPEILFRADADTNKVTATEPETTKESRMTDEEIQALVTRAETAEALVASMRTKETASADEFAAVDAERKAHKTELIVRDAESLMPFKTTADRAKYKEQASLACDDAGVVKHMIVERKVEALELKNEEQAEKIKLLELSESDKKADKGDMSGDKSSPTAHPQGDAAKTDAEKKADADKAAADKAAEDKAAADKAAADKAAGKKETASDDFAPGAAPKTSYGPIYRSHGAGDLSREELLNLA